MKEAGYYVAYLGTRGDFYAENATGLGVDEYGHLSEQTLPPFSNHEQHFTPFNHVCKAHLGKLDSNICFNNWSKECSYQRRVGGCIVVYNITQTIKKTLHHSNIKLVRTGKNEV